MTDFDGLAFLIYWLIGFAVLMGPLRWTYKAVRTRLQRRFAPVDPDLIPLRPIKLRGSR